jgi:sodium/potassium-transporting ATPase subunit alpha
MNGDEHKIPLEELYQRINSGPEGLSSSEAKRRLQQYGPNFLEVRKKIPLAFRFGKHLFNFFAILLWLGAALALVADHYSPGEGNFYISIALVAVVLLNSIFTFIQEYESEKIMESFRRMMPQRMEVLRDGRRWILDTVEIVPGDIIFLNEGDKIPADGRLVEEHTLKVDHSTLTGEAEPQLRKLVPTHENILESRNMVFSGTLVQSGNGTAVVYGTGMDTQLGHIARLTKETESVPSPLRKELRYFIRVISTIAIILGSGFFVAGLLMGSRFLTSMMFGIGILVANVPEGLLPTVTLCLSMVSRRMARNQAIIKRLESVETLGSTTVICTDKTGTITENRISLNTLFVNLEERNVFEIGLGETPGLTEFIQVAVLCNNARSSGQGSFHGDPTEVALLDFASRHTDVERLRTNMPRAEEHPFDSHTKRMITVNRRDGAMVSCLKGAPEEVIALCDRVLLEGRPVGLTESHRAVIARHYKRLASRGERVLAFALCEDCGPDKSHHFFVGLAGMLDPPRREIRGAVAKCRTAGIKTIMITGDYSVTAEAIARRAGLIVRGEASIMNGEELARVDEDNLMEFLRLDNIIFARTSPLQKLRIVRALQAMGEVVTVTGDGVNDAPALKSADMGVAMGLSGTEVAKEAADMVLMDDNFATIVNAVEEGRTVFSNIKKFIAYILTSNVPEIVPFIAFVLLGIPLPLTVVLILCIDLGTDILPALGLGVESPEDDVMLTLPRPRTERLLSRTLLYMSYGVVGMFQSVAGFFSYFIVLHWGGWHWGEPLAPLDPLYRKAVTSFFVSIVICQVANVMICRTRRESVFHKGILSNHLVLAGIAVELALVGLFVYSPFAHTVLGTSSLHTRELLLAVPFALFILVADEIRKAFVRKRNSFVLKYLSW